MITNKCTMNNEKEIKSQSPLLYPLLGENIKKQLSQLSGNMACLCDKYISNYMLKYNIDIEDMKVHGNFYKIYDVVNTRMCFNYKENVIFTIYCDVNNKNMIFNIFPNIPN